MAMRTTPRNITLDIGGTFIKCSDGRTVPVNSNGSCQEIVESLRKAVGDPDALDAIGVCIPGPFDYRDGVFLMKHKFASVYGESFRELAGIPERVVMRFSHDVIAPLRGLIRINPELKEGVVALITIGTGLGFSYSVDGIIQVNEKLSPAVSLYNRPLWGGILEDFVSRRGLLKLYGKPLEGDVKELAFLAGKGDAEAIAAFNKAGEALKESTGELLLGLGIRKLFVGGQIAKAFNYMDAPLRDALPSMEIIVIKDFEKFVFEGARI